MPEACAGALRRVDRAAVLLHDQLPCAGLESCAARAQQRVITGYLRQGQPKGTITPLPSQLPIAAMAAATGLRISTRLCSYRTAIVVLVGTGGQPCAGTSANAWCTESLPTRALQNLNVDIGQFQLLRALRDRSSPPEDLERRLAAAHKGGSKAPRAFDPVTLPKPGDRLRSRGVKHAAMGPPVEVRPPPPLPPAAHTGWLCSASLF